MVDCHMTMRQNRPYLNNAIEKARDRLYSNCTDVIVTVSMTTSYPCFLCGCLYSVAISMSSRFAVIMFTVMDLSSVTMKFS